MSERVITFRDAIREAFEEEMMRNPDIVIVGEDVLDAELQPVLDGFEKKFPGRIVNHLPLVEDMLPTIGLGMAMGGLRPVIQLNYETFLALGLDGIYMLGIWRYRMGERHGPPMLIRVGHEGYLAKGPELGTSFLSFLLHLPNIVVATPSLPYHAKGLLKTALRAQQPVVFVEHKLLYDAKGSVPPGDFTIPFGCSTVLRKGIHATIVSWMLTSYLARDAAKQLKEKSIDLEVITLHTIHPMDMSAILRSAQKTGRVLIVEEDMLRGGVGAEIAARLSEQLPSCRIARVAAKNVPLPGSPAYEKAVLPSVAGIVRAAEALVRQNKS